MKEGKVYLTFSANCQIALNLLITMVLFDFRYRQNCGSNVG